MSGIDIAIIVGVLIATLGAGAFFLIRHLRSKRKKAAQFDFTTKHGIDVKLSPELSDLKPEAVEEWTESVVSFWEEKRGWSREKMLKNLAKVGIFLYDEPYLNRAGIKVNGITWPNKFEIEMATLPKEGSSQTAFGKVKSLFRHETSHVLAGYVGGVVFDNAIHHALFAEVKLGA